MIVLQDVTIGGKLDKGYRGSFYIICFNCICTESDLTEATKQQQQQQSICILLLEETFVQVQTLQQRVPGPSLSQWQLGGVLQNSEEAGFHEHFFTYRSWPLSLCPQH